MPRVHPRERSESLGAAYPAESLGLIRFLRARGAGDQVEDLVEELRATHPIDAPTGDLFDAANRLMINRHRSSQSGSRDQKAASCVTATAASHAIAKAEERLRSLGQRVLRAFVLFRVDGIPQREIARQLGVSVGTVEKDLQSAYRAIIDVENQFDAAS